jgi:HEAT repeat protein
MTVAKSPFIPAYCLVLTLLLTPVSTEAAMTGAPESDPQAMLSLLGSEHGDYKNAVQWFKSQGKGQAPFLISAFNDTHTSSLQQARIIETLGELQDDKAIPLLAKSLQEDRWTWDAAQALGKIGTRAAEAILTQKLRDPRLNIVKECTKALAYFKTETARATLQNLLQHTDAAERYYAALSLIQSQPERAVETLRRHLQQEPDIEVRQLIERFFSKQ